MIICAGSALTGVESCARYARRSVELYVFDDKAYLSWNDTSPAGLMTEQDLMG